MATQADQKKELWMTQHAQWAKIQACCDDVLQEKFSRIDLKYIGKDFKQYRVAVFRCGAYVRIDFKNLKNRKEKPGENIKHD